MLISKKIEIDMGHRVPNHKSKCKNLHGHRYKIKAGVNDKVITKKGDSSEGMVIDFGDLKEVMMEEIHDKYDHGFVMYKNDVFVGVFKELKEEHKQNIHFVDFIPTAENLAIFWFNILKIALEAKNIKLEFIEVWETPNSVAIYTIDNWEVD
jgi:6-pyruvoyltetrahydropterin/6-carboxytetrahydropterin synthase